MTQVYNCGIIQYISQTGLGGDREITVWTDTKPDLPLFVLYRFDDNRWFISEPMATNEQAQMEITEVTGNLKTNFSCTCTVHRFGEPLVLRLRKG